MDQMERRHPVTSTSATASYTSEHISIQISSEFADSVQTTALKHSFSTATVVHHIEHQFVTKLQLTRLHYHILFLIYIRWSLSQVIGLPPFKLRISGRMGGRGFEAPSRGWGMGRGFPPLQPTKGSGECHELPQWGPGQSPGRKRISVLSKCHRMPIVETFVVN